MPNSVAHCKKRPGLPLGHGPPVENHWLNQMQGRDVVCKRATRWRHSRSARNNTEEIICAGNGHFISVDTIAIILPDIQCRQKLLPALSGPSVGKR